MQKVKGKSKIKLFKNNKNLLHWSPEHCPDSPRAAVYSAAA